MATEKQLIEVSVARGYAESLIADPILKMAVNAVLNKTPRVDAVEVVRCKNCRWARTQDHREPAATPEQLLICECFMHHYIPAPWGARMAVNPDDFCSYGERRTDYDNSECN